MVVCNLTESKYWDIGENYLNWTHLRPNNILSQKQNEFIDAFTMVHQSSYCHIQAVMNNLKFIILYYLAAKKSWILDWRIDFCDWFKCRHSIWRIIPSRHLTEYNTLRDNVPHKHTQHWLIDWNRGAAACLERYFQHKPCPCMTQ